MTFALVQSSSSGWPASSAASRRSSVRIRIVVLDGLGHGLRSSRFRGHGRHEGFGGRNVFAVDSHAVLVVTERLAAFFYSCRSGPRTSCGFDGDPWR